MPSYTTPTSSNMQYYGGKLLRVFVNGAELPAVRAGVDEGSARRIEIQHSLSQGGTDIDVGMKAPATFTLNLAHDLKNDPLNASGLNLRGGQRVTLIEIFPFGGTGATPSGPKHVFNNAVIEGNPFNTELNGAPTLQISGASSTRDYTYVPLNGGGSGSGTGV